MSITHASNDQHTSDILALKIQPRHLSIVLTVAWLLGGLAAAAAARPQTAGGEESATIRMDDDFAYEIVDYGLGLVEACAPRSVRQPSAFWFRIKLTNRSEHLLGSPGYFSRIGVSDNWGNRYQKTLLCRLSKQDRYKPGESAIETVTIAAREFVDDMHELRVSLDRDANVFVIRDPLKRRQDLRRGHNDADPRDLSVRVDTGSGATNAATVGDTDKGCGPGVTCPQVLREVSPQYTSDAMRAKIQGTVSLEILVRPDGTVSDVQVVRSLDTTFGLDQEAIKAAKAWRFVPGIRDGQPVPVRMTIELVFTLR